MNFSNPKQISREISVDNCKEIISEYRYTASVRQADSHSVNLKSFMPKVFYVFDFSVVRLEHFLLIQKHLWIILSDTTTCFA